MKQKLGISLITAWYALAGILMLLIAAGIGFGGTETGIPEEIAEIGAGAFGIVALIALTLAYGIYNLESWGWYAAVILNSICAFAAMIQANICGLVIPAIIIWYLWVNQREFRVSVNL
ncbi:MAG: hypothetical protein ACXQTR_04380 [Candidatus Methanospirareceae archaeon]